MSPRICHWRVPMPTCWQRKQPHCFAHLRHLRGWGRARATGPPTSAGATGTTTSAGAAGAPRQVRRPDPRPARAGHRTIDIDSYARCGARRRLDPAAHTPSLRPIVGRGDSARVRETSWQPARVTKRSFLSHCRARRSAGTSGCATLSPMSAAPASSTRCRRDTHTCDGRITDIPAHPACTCSDRSRLASAPSDARGCSPSTRRRTSP